MSLFKSALIGGTNTPAIDTSPKYSFNYVDTVKLLIEAGILGSTTALTFIVEHIGGIDFGVYTSIVVLVANTGLSAFIKWLKDNNPYKENK